ncbi:MAG TPA: signal peptidase I [Armatimonadota bacterium]|nr:signal peptidase I [Armatimonadota bacterium]
MLNLDSPWQIVAIVAAVGLLRVMYTVWKDAPSRALMLELADSLLIAFALVFFLVKPFVVAAFYIPSESMLPTLRPNDRVLVNKFILHLTAPRRQDIIVFEAPREAVGDGVQKDFIKRLIGLPGDTVEVRSYDGVYVNGVKLDEPYIDALHMADYDFPVDKEGRRLPPHKVPLGHYLVMGDNRNDSNDSHRWGDLPAQNVLGKAMVIFWPPGRTRLAR